jgi:PKD repeat protein
VNDPPTAADDAAEMDEDTAVTIDVLANDSDPDGDALAVASVTQGAHGTVSSDGSSVTYTPEAGWTGDDTFTYVATDGSLESNAATVTVTVREISNDVVVDDQDANTSRTGTWQTSSGADPWAGRSLYAGSGPTSGADATFRWIPELRAAGVYEVHAWWTYHSNRSYNVPYTVSHGSGTDTVVVDQHDQSLAGQWNLLGTYTFEAGGAGYAEVSAADGQACADAVMFVYKGEEPNTPPVAEDQSVTTDEDTSCGITLTATDADGDALTYAIVDGPANGSLTGDAPDLTYAPNADFSGEDSFTFKANDGEADSNIATVTITVIEINDPPVAVATADVTSGDAPLTVNFDGSGSSDVDGEIIDYEWDLDGVSDYGAQITHVFTEPGVYAVTLYVFDDDGDVDWFDITITVTDAGPSEVIVDNRDSNTESTGTWNISSGADPWEGESLYSNSGSTFRWIPQVPSDGEYEVYAWWTYHANRSQTVPYTIVHAYGQLRVVVNQHDSSKGGQWNLLATCALEAGSAGYVEVSSSDGQACADAVKVVRIGDMPPPPPSTVTVDNKDANTEKTGTWSVSSGPSPWAGQSLYAGSGPTSGADATFRWIPELPEAGEYEVYVWWTYHSNRCYDVPYTIAHAGGTDVVTMNQHDQSTAGQWNLLGTYTFEAGSAGWVEVSAAEGQACADAVSFVVPGGSPPETIVLDGEAAAGLGDVPEWPVAYGEGEDDVMWVASDIPVSALEGDDGPAEGELPDGGDSLNDDNPLDAAGGGGGGAGGCFVGTVR